MKANNYTIKQTSLFLLIILSIFSTKTFAEKTIPTEARNHTISGQIYDAQSRQPMAYATVSIHQASDSSLINGTVTDNSGVFNVSVQNPGKYIVKASYIGFETIFQDIEIQKNEKQKDLGRLHLKPAANMMEEVTVEGNKYAMDYQIDKKVIHVSRQHASLSGTAVDALQYAPSIQVDIEGNVSLRGNSNFTVLIDGKPSVLTATEALEQIPASSVKDIEIITNPSAKYDPEGTAGIINIITKKRSLNGLSGLAHANIGLDNKYGADILLNYKTDYFSFFISGDYNQRTYPGSMEKDSRFYGDTSYYLLSSGERERQRERYSFRGGIEWFPDEKQTISLNGRYGSRKSDRISSTEFTEWNSANPEKYEYTSEETGNRGGDFYSLEANYIYQVNPKHQFDAQLMAYSREGEDVSINRLLTQSGSIQNAQKSMESGPSTGFRYRLNYKRPFSKAFNIEAGFQGRYRDSKEDNEVHLFDTVSQEYILQENFSHNVKYLRNIHAGYGLVRGEFKDFGYQLGLRSEYTYRDIQLTDIGDQFTIDRWDFFPTTHFSYSINETNQVMASYTRRIDRPHGWYLEPFITWQNAYSVRRGNPDLQPEYINAFEVAYQKEFGKHAVSAELFYRTTENNIERIQRVYRENIVMNTFENVGKDISVGIELMINVELLKWWEADITASFYDYRVIGSLDDVEFDKHSLTYNVRMNNSFRIWENTTIQLNPAYNGPEVEPQERESAYWDIDGAIQQSFFNKKLKATLQVRDIFGTAKYESFTEGADFYEYTLYQHKTPIVILNLSYTINNFKNNDAPIDALDMGGEG
ncbi:MAG: TonB-dependent receptor [Bacteroidales bacterium]|jgi:outer membrane cobalamin receptor|nr:TonB-dependent receptor [Bacteroidales bacterium]